MGHHAGRAKTPSPRGKKPSECPLSEFCSQRIEAMRERGQGTRGRGDEENETVPDRFRQPLLFWNVVSVVNVLNVSNVSNGAEWPEWLEGLPVGFQSVATRQARPFASSTL